MYRDVARHSSRGGRHFFSRCGGEGPGRVTLGAVEEVQVGAGKSRLRCRSGLQGHGFSLTRAVDSLYQILQSLP